MSSVKSKPWRLACEIIFFPTQNKSLNDIIETKMKRTESGSRDYGG